MNPANIIREAQTDGVRLALSPSGKIKVSGDGAAVNRWLAVIREHKAEILDVLKVGTGDTAPTSRCWLLHYIDRDPLEVTCYPEATHVEILERHPDAIAAEPFTPALRHPSAPMAADAEEAVRARLKSIEETEPATIAGVINRCQEDAKSRDYFIGWAAVELPNPDPFPDDRRTCDQCANLIARRCQAVKRGEIMANRNYEPIHDLLRRCEGYAPRADDTDRRPGRERWPELTDTKGTK